MPPQIAVDVVIPVYGERPEALEATLEACLQQDHPVSRFYVVDDCSPDPVSLPTRVAATGKVHLMRLPRNRGISAARNAAIEKCTSPLVACVNCEILLAPDWLATCANYFLRYNDVGACFTRMVPCCPERLLTRWRMRFQEPSFEREAGSAPFAPGHAVLFRREAILKVGGYDVRFRRLDEDFDICQRMRKAGWQTHFVAQSKCFSIQQDTFRSLCNKQLRNGGWGSPEDYSLGRLFLSETRWLAVRLGRNLVKGRLLFLPLDFLVWVGALGIAVRKTLDARKRPSCDSEVQP